MGGIFLIPSSLIGWKYHLYRNLYPPIKSKNVLFIFSAHFEFCWQDLIICFHTLQRFCLLIELCGITPVSIQFNYLAQSSIQHIFLLREGSSLLTLRLRSVAIVFNIALIFYTDFGRTIGFFLAISITNYFLDWFRQWEQYFLQFNSALSVASNQCENGFAPKWFNGHYIYCSIAILCFKIWNKNALAAFFKS